MNIPKKYESEINRESVLVLGREALFQLMKQEPRIMSLTLYMKENYGYSTLRVFLTRELRSQLPEPDLDLSSLLEHTEHYSNETPEAD